jgi:hypothetical protein
MDPRARPAPTMRIALKLTFAFQVAIAALVAWGTLTLR